MRCVRVWERVSGCASVNGRVSLCVCVCGRKGREKTEAGYPPESSAVVLARVPTREGKALEKLVSPWAQRSPGLGGGSRLPFPPHPSLSPFSLGEAA